VCDLVVGLVAVAWGGAGGETMGGVDVGGGGGGGGIVPHTHSKKKSAARKLEHNMLVYSPTWEWNAGILDNQKANMALLLSNKK